MAAALTAWAVANGPIPVGPSGDVIWRSLFVAACVAVGMFTWWRRRSRLGPIVAGAGFLYGSISLNASGVPPSYALGMVAWAAYIVYTGMHLCLPGGRLESRLGRAFGRSRSSDRHRGSSGPPSGERRE